ncbi:hypothetical protein [Archangium sp.]|uniref:hypothetical protein n=1 Tax=Archangium sp. TaxID=1872627 RepID=UPI002D569884|nr:hypothetical protein [Archangium sp.]HYO54158.1 hypothetical protein [Archangium sp.]
MKSMMRLCLMSLAWVLSACGPSGDPDVGYEGPCIAVVVYARAASGGDCQQFGTPCAVPRGYVQCCGGLGYGKCQQGQCVDDPTDSCSPQGSGADCPGICQ